MLTDKISPGLLPCALERAPLRRTAVVVELHHIGAERVARPAHQPRQHRYAIVQQPPVGQLQDARLPHGAIHPDPLAGSDSLDPRDLQNPAVDPPSPPRRSRRLAPAAPTCPANAPGRAAQSRYQHRPDHTPTGRPTTPNGPNHLIWLRSIRFARRAPAGQQIPEEQSDPACDPHVPSPPSPGAGAGFTLLQGPGSASERRYDTHGPSAAIGGHFDPRGHSGYLAPGGRAPRPGPDRDLQPGQRASRAVRCEPVGSLEFGEDRTVWRCDAEGRLSGDILLDSVGRLHLYTRHGSAGLATLFIVIFGGAGYLSGVLIWHVLVEFGRAIAHPSECCGCLLDDDEVGHPRRSPCAVSASVRERLILQRTAGSTHSAWWIQRTG